MAILGKTSVTSLEVLNQIKSNVATGTAPLAVNSTTLVSNLNADYLDGYHATTASVGNTVVIRTSEGYINTSFINTGIENQDNIDISAVYYEGFSDKFIRKCSPVRFRNYLISPYIKGAGATTVTTDSTTGTITISSTNSDTKVTSAANHYNPGYTGTSLTKNTSGANYYLTGVTLTLDGKGHVTALGGGESYDDNTNTHYTTRLYAGASGTAAHSAVTNPYLKVTDDNTYRNQVRFVGGGATTITSDSAGTITITSTDTNTDTNNYLTGVSGSGNGTVTFTRQGLGSLTWNASHTHSEYSGTGHTHSYLSLSGGEMANQNLVKNLNADLLDGYSGSAFSKTGHTHSNYVSTAGGSVVAGTTNFNKIQISGAGTTYGTGATLFFGDSETEVYLRNTADKDLTIYANGTLNLNGGSVLINGYTPSRITGATGTVSNTTGTPSVSIATGGTASAQTLSFTFTNIKGAKGDKGDKGDTGNPGTNGSDGRSVGSLVCTKGTGSTTTATTSTSAGATNYYRIKDTSGNWLSGGIAIKNGSNGTNGTNGTNGKDGTNGSDGRSVGSLVCVGGSASTTTTTPSTANDGTSYYRVKDTAGNWLSGYIAVKNGSKGSNGTNGTNGSDGADGRSVGSIVCVGGSASTTTTTPNTANEGTSYYRIKDTAGNWLSGYIAVKNGAKGSNGTNGTNGTNGKDGTNGSDGDDGFGIYFANTTTQTGTEIIAKSYITTNSRTPQIGDFILSYNGFLYKITSGWTTSKSYAYISYLTTLKGSDGAKGSNGSNGTNGTNGSDGADGLSMFYCSSGYTSGQTSMSRSYLTPSATVKTPIKGDLVITSGGLLFSVTSVSAATLSVSYLTSLKGANGSNGSPGTNGTNGTNGKSVTQVVCTSSLTSTSAATINTADGATNYYRFKDSSGGFITGGIIVKNGSSGSTTTTTTTDEKVKSQTSSDKLYLLGTNVAQTTTGTTYKNLNIYMSGSTTANSTLFTPRISATTITASTAFYQSDERLKDFCGEIDVDFEKLKEIPKKYYTWKSDENKELQIGTSAQKVLEVYPELVGGSEDTNYAVDYARLSIVALKAIDKLHDENQTLRDLVEKMDKRITELEEKLK